MTQTQHIAFWIFIASVLLFGIYALVDQLPRMQRRWTKYAFTLALSETDETQLVPSIPARQPVWPWRGGSRNMPAALSRASQTSGPDESYGTREVSVIRQKPSWRRRFVVPLVFLVVLAALGVGFTVGNGYGKNHVVKASLNRTGWLMTTFSVDGAVTPATSETVFLFWNNTATPHDLHADWYLIDPSKAKHPLQSDIKVDAADDGQGGITIIAHTATGDITVNGTLSGATLTLKMRPNSYLFPAVPAAFFTMTFAPSTTDAFNHLVSGGA